MQSPFKRITDPVDGSMHIVVGCTALDSGEMRAPCHITYVIQAQGTPAFSGDQVFGRRSTPPAGWRHRRRSPMPWCS
jgi:hypothetical protein